MKPSELLQKMVTQNPHWFESGVWCSVTDGEPCFCAVGAIAYATGFKGHDANISQMYEHFKAHYPIMLEPVPPGEALDINMIAAVGPGNSLASQCNERFEEPEDADEEGERLEDAAAAIKVVEWLQSIGQ